MADEEWLERPKGLASSAYQVRTDWILEVGGSLLGCSGARITPKDVKQSCHVAGQAHQETLRKGWVVLKECFCQRIHAISFPSSLVDGSAAF